jgi:hypothetical protein
MIVFDGNVFWPLSFWLRMPGWPADTIGVLAWTLICAGTIARWLFATHTHTVFWNSCCENNFHGSIAEEEKCFISIKKNQCNVCSIDDGSSMRVAPPLLSTGISSNVIASPECSNVVVVVVVVVVVDARGFFLVNCEEGEEKKMSENSHNNHTNIECNYRKTKFVHCSELKCC